MTTLFERVVEARQALGKLRESTASPETKAGYMRTAEALVTRAKGEGEALVADVLAPKAASTFYRQKAALHHYLRVKLMEALVEQERHQKAMKAAPDRSTAEWKRLEWESSVERLEAVAGLARKVADFLSGIPDPDKPGETKSPLLTRKPRHSKRADLSRLPSNWRELLAEHLRDHPEKVLKGKPIPARPYKTAFMLCGVAGMRPAELKKGVRLDVVGDELVITVSGAKVRENAGQPTRTLRFKLGSHPFVDALASRPGVVQIADTARFSEAVRAAGQRKWPKLSVSVRPYSARHQVAADWKADGLSSEEIAMGLGHSTDKTGGLYGERQQGKGGGVKLASVEAARGVKGVKKPLPASAADAGYRPKLR